MMISGETNRESGIAPNPNKFTLVLDSSQITAFLECPQYWSYSYQQRLGLPHLQEKNEAMNAGTYGHKLLELYYLARLTGKNLNAAMEEAFSWNPDDEVCECGCKKAEHFHPTHEIEDSGCFKCTGPNSIKVCVEYKAAPFLLSQDQRIAVRTRLREYFFTYANSDFLPNNPSAVEVGFSELLFEDTDNLFVIEGRIDLIGTLQGLPTIVDHKFQQRAHQLYKKSVQFKNYAFVSKIPMLIVNYIRLTKGVSKDTLMRDIVTFNSLEMNQWRKQLIEIFFRIKQQIVSGTYEQNWSNCGGRYGYNCIFTPLCEEVQPDLVQIKKQQLYVEKQEWKPW